MLSEIFKELVAAYCRWHSKQHGLSIVLLAVVGLLALHGAWAGACGIASMNLPASQRRAVTGRVTWQGRPLDTGIVSFRPLDGQPFDGGAVIQDGRFAIPRAKGLTPGRYLVRIHASKADVSLPPPAFGQHDTRPGIEVLPQKYNSASELTAEIRSWGASTVSFELAP